MPIIRVSPSQRERFVIIDKTGLEDSALSFKAKGLLAYLLTLPDNWRVAYRHLERVGPDGKVAVLAGLKELEDAGYLKRERRHLGGRYHWEQVLYERPPHNESETGALSRSVSNALKTGARSEEPKSEIRNASKTEPPNLQPAYEICEECGLAVRREDLSRHRAGSHQRTEGAA